MTPENQRIAIATHLGWTFHDLKYAHVGNGAVFEQFWLRPGVDITKLTADQIAWDEGQIEVPNFCGSLDAMHEAEKKLTPDQRDRYEALLSVRCGDDYHEHKTHWSARIHHANAAQRCAAMVRALGLWKDEEGA